VSVARASSKAAAHTGGGGETHRRADTRDRVLQVAQALFAERGYRGTSLRDISARIGIRAPSLLHHFSSKEALYLAVLERVFDRLDQAAGSLLARTDGGFRDSIRDAIEGSIDFIARRPDFARILWNEFIDERGTGRQLFKRRVPPLWGTLQNFIREGQQGGEFRREVDAFHFSLSLASIILGYFATATMVRRLWSTNLLENHMIDRRKREVMDLVAHTLFRRNR
jgi:TetR/AcrR family transcriptional regulator